MDLSKIPLLTGLAARTSVIARNIAKADTPNYVAQDVKAPNFKAMASAASEMQIADPRHIAAAPGIRSGGNQVQELTLVFVPRIIVMFITIAICLPFMGGALGKFATKLYGRIAVGGIGGG